MASNIHVMCYERSLRLMSFKSRSKHLKPFQWQAQSCINLAIPRLYQSWLLSSWVKLDRDISTQMPFLRTVLAQSLLSETTWADLQTRLLQTVLHKLYKVKEACREIGRHAMHYSERSYPNKGLCKNVNVC